MLRRRDRSTDIIARSVSIVGRNINGRNKNGLFSRDRMIIGRSHTPFNGSRDIPSGGVNRTYNVTTTRVGQNVRWTGGRELVRDNPECSWR